MSKSLKKLIDINRLREFKNKLVGTDSPCVQTGAVDQTVAGTKTFSKPIVGSVTGSSGSCTGNAATATTATTAKSCTGNAATATTATTAKSCTGNAATATQFSANATVALTGDATGTSAGSKKGWSVPVTLANSGVTAGTYGPSADVTGNNNATISVPEITVDAKGRVTSVVNRTLTCKNDTYKVYNKTLTIQKNGTNVATFTSNSNTDVAANITVPTKVSELTNDSGFLTSHQSLSNYVTLNGAQTISGAKTFTGNIIGINKERSTENANDLYSTTAGSKLTYYTTSNGGTTLTNVPAAANTTLESRTIRRLSDSDWIVEQICHNSNGLYYRKGSNGTWGAWKTFAFTDSNISGNAATATTATTAQACTGNAATATKLATARTINGTAFNGTANITTANWGTARDISIADATATNSGEAVSVNGSTAVTLKLPATIKASLDGNAATATSATTAASATTATNATNATKLGNIASSGYVQTGKVNQTIDGTKTFSAAIVGSVTGNAGSATKLATARTINGTAFNGTANITTANWGTARNISITDGTNTSTAVSVNGSANVSLNLPSTIKATFVGNVTGNVTGNCSGSSGSCTGNAATATKLAAKRTIALSGAATGTATGFDGSGNITIPVTALAASAIRAQWYAAYPDGAEAHNAMWGGRDITAAFNNGTVSANIANGTFRDIFPGDYITKQVTIPQVLADDGTTELFTGGTYTVNWVIADCDYWINKGDDTAMTTHHVAIVPQTRWIFSARMNLTNTTEGGYAGSEMYRNVIPACATGIVNAFGSDHILTFRDSIVRAVNSSSISSGAPFWTGASSDWGWYDARCNLMSERMVYGMPAFSSSAWDAGVATRQFSAFRLSEKLISDNRAWYWLRDIVSSADFACVDGNGAANANNASYVGGVRPFALLR